MQPVYVAKDPHDKALQRALLQWRKPELRRLVIEALHKAHREDLIGYDRHCLIRPLNSGRKKEEPGRGGPKEERGRSGRSQGANQRARSARKEGKQDKRTAPRDARSGRERTPVKPALKPAQKRSGKNNGGKKRRG